MDRGPLRIFTWHIHGSYLYFLSNVPHTIYVPVKPDHSEGYTGLPAGGFPWPENLVEVPAYMVKSLEFDCILFQTRKQYMEDQYEILSEAQRHLPRLYLEHDPPCEHPTDMRHWVDDPSMLLVHVTPFNDLMWDCGSTPTRVIEHGVTVPQGVRYTGEMDRGIVVINHLAQRGRRLGSDIFERARHSVPLDLVGMGWKDVGGLGEIPHDKLPQFTAPYRFFFNPIRYTSLGLAVCEAMMIGMPIVGLATTEMATLIENEVSGYVDTNVDRLVEFMHYLIDEPDAARRLGKGARFAALQRFNIERFAADWCAVFQEVVEERVRHGAKGEWIKPVTPQLAGRLDGSGGPMRA